MAFFRAHQLSIMLFESGMCAMLAVLTLVTRSISPKRRHILANMEAGAAILLLADYCAYVYRGKPGALGYWLVRISNFLVYFFILYLLNTFTDYLTDVYLNEEQKTKLPRGLKAAKLFYLIGTALVIISQFTGLYYTFDENNLYRRSPAFVLCYLFPLLITSIHLSIILRHHKRMSRNMFVTFLLFTVVPLLASVVQVFTYGLSLTNMSMVLMAIVVFFFTFIDVNQKAERANRLEVEYLKHEQTKIRNLFGQTTEALTDAIDAKDEYTRGHSARVAEYATMLAKASGMSANECEEVYFAGLLHDVGKIGIPDDIIHKPGKLTAGEYDIVKDHPVIGSRILSVITESPYLSIGAHYHHERWDGTGYPDGLMGEEIPVIARIISVADAYDAMTSERSYRTPFPQSKVREEIVKGIGSQFDPRYGQLMVELIDRDVDFTMKDAEDY